eukprot:CAMPEP_0174715854 /NCGR_PEP_ID=MMETSP1094-20130205/22651_1 /TAXON_ID=156173 /ORGANISM="Chrysochromulina brevifilum, Strain UTEX LB 985" /LENGTH=151 /DNA_ID=CAMNT_0015915517 /DNA_START=41 /DNA_END=496 /DNA_ORIENTATION=-
MPAMQQKNPLEHVMSSMGKMRDIDGTIDRCVPPTRDLWPILFALRLKCEDENIELESRFIEGTGNKFGLIARAKFETVFVDTFSRYHITDDTLARIRDHYGTGYTDVRGYKENVSFKDFCEDVMNATDTTNGKAAMLAAKSGAILDVRSFQ